MKSCTASSGFAPSTCVHFLSVQKCVAACLYNVHQTQNGCRLPTAPARMRGHRLLAYPTSSQPTESVSIGSVTRNDGNNLDSFKPHEDPTTRSICVLDVEDCLQAGLSTGLWPSEQHDYIMAGSSMSTIRAKITRSNPSLTKYSKASPM